MPHSLRTSPSDSITPSAIRACSSFASGEWSPSRNGSISAHACSARSLSRSRISWNVTCSEPVPYKRRMMSCSRSGMPTRSDSRIRPPFARHDGGGRSSREGKAAHGFSASKNPSNSGSRNCLASVALMSASKAMLCARVTRGNSRVWPRMTWCSSCMTSRNRCSSRAQYCSTKVGFRDRRERAPTSTAAVGTVSVSTISVSDRILCMWNEAAGTTS